MSLTQEDLQHIEAIFNRKLNPVLGELPALREGILTLNAQLLAAAKQAGITLPRS